MKKEININNYEKYVIDFLEGSLSPEMKSAFLNFLTDNPDVAEEIRDINEVGLSGNEIVYEKKDNLKKPVIEKVAEINEDTYEEVFIAYHEGDLDQERKKQLDKFIDTNTILAKELEIHSKLNLTPDYSIKYEKKESLKRVRKVPIIRYASIAAVMIILIGWSFSMFIKPVEKRDQFSLNKLELRSANVYISKDIYPFIPNKKENVIIPEIIEEPEYGVTINNPRTAIGLSQMYTKATDTPLSDAYDYARLIDNSNFGYNYNLAILESNSSNNTREKSIFASVISNQWNKLTGQFSRPEKVSKDKNEPTYVQVLETGITVFNTITGSETYTSKTFNSEGELTSYQVGGRELVLNRNRGSGSAH